MFREYIIQFARLVDVDLTGDPIVIGNNGAKLIFLVRFEHRAEP